MPVGVVGDDGVVVQEVVEGEHDIGLDLVPIQQQVVDEIVVQGLRVIMDHVIHKVVMQQAEVSIQELYDADHIVDTVQPNETISYLIHNYHDEIFVLAISIRVDIHDWMDVLDEVDLLLFLQIQVDRETLMLFSDDE